jgi:hypothetical protein
VQSLLVGRRGNRHRHVLPRVQRGGDAANGAALAGRVGAFEREDQRPIGKAPVPRHPRELALVFLDLALVLLFGRAFHVELADQPDVVGHGRASG